MKAFITTFCAILAAGAVVRLMHVILAVYVISAVSLLVIYFLVNRQRDYDERPMKTKK